MVAYTEPARDPDHDRFIERLNRDMSTRMFESHVRDIQQAAKRCRAGTLARSAFLGLLFEKLPLLRYYVAGGPLDKAIAGHRRLMAALEEKNTGPLGEAQAQAIVEAMAETMHAYDDPDALDEAAGEATAKQECSNPQSDSGTELASSNSKCEGRDEVEE